MKDVGNEREVSFSGVILRTLSHHNRIGIHRHLLSEYQQRGLFGRFLLVSLFLGWRKFVVKQIEELVYLIHL